MVQQLRSGADILGPALANILQAVDKVKNPNRELQEGMVKAFATNPDLIQHFANLENAAPGTAQKLGLGPILSQLIQGVPEQADVKFNRENASQINANKSTALKNQGTQGQIDSQTLEGAAKLLAEHSGMGEERIFKFLGIDTPAEKKAKELALANGEITLDLNKKKLDEVQRADDLRKQSRIFENVSVRGLAHKLMTGNLTGLEAQALMANPELSNSLSPVISQMKDERNFEQQKIIAGIQAANRSTNSTEVKEGVKVQLAASRYAAAQTQGGGPVGTLNAWENYLFDPEATAKVRDFVKNPSATVKPEDEPYKEIAQYIVKTGQESQQKDTYEIVKINQGVDQAEKAVLSSNKDDRDSKLASLNQALQQRAQYGAPNYVAEWHDNKLGFDGGDHIVYKLNGKPVDTKTVTETIHDPNYRVPELGPQEMKAAQMIMNSESPNAAFALLQTQNPKLAPAVKKYLQAQGSLK